MQYIADLHVHSPYSRATSRQSTLAGLAAWARVKGIHLVGTGDFTHPQWFRAIEEELEEAAQGCYRLRPGVPLPELGITAEPLPVRFVLTTEISSIYKKDGRVRKIHNLVFASGLEAARRITGRLAGIGNIAADGRPILGLDARDLLEIVLETDPQGFLVPAHIWTPWFSLFGAKSGFDSLEECFGDLAGHVFCLETGLSSDPAMNRLVSALDRCTLISNSDCHSPAKLGREANLLAGAVDFSGLRRALETGQGLLGTIEFYPEEGKYHYDGHRKCAVVLTPQETRAAGGRCPACGRPVTVGVHHRVLELADREQPVYPDPRVGFESLVPLAEILGELRGCGANTKKVAADYGRLVARFGSEFAVLRQAPVEDLDRELPLLGEAVGRMRAGRVIRQPGFDGQFGVIRLFADGEIQRLRGQKGLFGPAAAPEPAAGAPSAAEPQPSRRETAAPATASTRPPAANPEQQAAITSDHPHILVAAGPGSGKTFTLVTRLRRLLAATPEAARWTVVITFTNKAAEEIRCRLGLAATDTGPFVGTFHGFCLTWLRRWQPELRPAGPEERDLLFSRVFPAAGRAERAALAAAVAQLGAVPGPPPREIQPYLAELERCTMVDLDLVTGRLLDHCRADERKAEELRAAVRHLFIDEFQDCNQAQYDLVRFLGGTASVFAIGDPDQAIYGFRGSDPRHFHDFAAGGPGTPQVQRITLQRNYRSGAAIVQAAGRLIRHNPDHTVATPEAAADRPGTIQFHLAASPQAEAARVVEVIEGCVGGVSHFSIDSGRGGDGDEAVSFADIAVLYRHRRLGEAVRDALHRRSIPIQEVGEPPFYTKGETAPLYYRLLALAGVATPAELVRFLATNPGVGGATVRRLEDLALTARGPDFPAALMAAPPAPAVATNLAALAEERRRWADRPVRETILGLAGDRAGEPAIQRLATLAAPFATDLAGFAAYLQENASGWQHDPRLEAVSLLTAHAAKGLEFPVVFVVGLEEGSFPLLAPDTDLAEERRLFYVAVTRARDRLYLSAARQRQVHGRTQPQQPSRFIAELGPGVTRHHGPTRPRRRQAQQLSLF